MQRVKTFFLVCGGIFLLTLSWQMGAQNATAQTATAFDCVGFNGGDAYAVVGRTLVWERSGNGTPYSSVPIPGTARAIACSSGSVLLEDGAIYTIATSNGDWSYRGNLFGSTTSSQRHTLGQLKQLYRSKSTAR